MSITVPCERGVFDMMFQHSGCKRSNTKKGDRLTLITSPPDTTTKLCGFIGMQHMPKMRRFHNRDAQGNWSTTHVDPTKEMKLVWKSKVRSMDTPTGKREDRKNTLTIKFNIDSDVLVHKDIRKVMKEEMKVPPKENFTWEDPTAQLKDLQATVNRQGGLTLDLTDQVKMLKKQVALCKNAWKESARLNRSWRLTCMLRERRARMHTLHVQLTNFTFLINYIIEHVRELMRARWSSRWRRTRDFRELAACKVTKLRM